MTIAEYKAKKRDAEQQIYELLKRFNEETGASVSGVDVDMVPTASGRDLIVSVTIIATI